MLKNLGLKILGLLLILSLLAVWPLSVEVRANSSAPTTPNPQHGIHAPVGFRWTDSDRQELAAFHNAAGLPSGPGLVVALSVDMTAANNAGQVPMERDLRGYQAQGSQILVRMWPQRFPGGRSEIADPSRGNVSGTPDDAADDILRFLGEQEAREGWHFTDIIPGNEMNIEWPNGSYDQNLLPWISNDDPAKYKAINEFMSGLERAWQLRVASPEGRRFQDVRLYFPALAQDGAPDHFAGFYFYADTKPAGNKYDLVRPAIEAFGNFSWHNYWRPGHAWEDRAIAEFPDWLKADLSGSGPNKPVLPGIITESGWSPKSLTNEQPDPALGLWQDLPFQLWQLPPNTRDFFTRTQDDLINGRRFEDDLEYFINVCSGAAYGKPQPAPGIAVWLAGSSSGFPEAAGLWRNLKPSRWFSNYAAWNF